MSPLTPVIPYRGDTFEEENFSPVGDFHPHSRPIDIAETNKKSADAVERRSALFNMPL